MRDNKCFVVEHFFFLKAGNFSFIYNLFKLMKQTEIERTKLNSVDKVRNTTCTNNMCVHRQTYSRKLYIFLHILLKQIGK